MKRAWILITVIASMAITISCEKLEPTPQFTKSDVSFSVTAAVTSVAVAAKDSLVEVISFTWIDPQYSVGLSQSKFRLIVGAAGKEFVSFSSKDFSGVLSGGLLAKEINAMALKFGGVIGQPITLDVKTVASQVNNNEQKNSNVLQVVVTPYGDVTLKASSTSVVCTAATSSQVGTSFTWNAAFNGYSGVKMYQLQYAKGGTSFAAPTSVDMSTLTKSFTQLELNKIALTYGVGAGTTGPVDFRIKATNESGTLLYSNVVTISITPYVAYNSIGIIGDATPGGWGTDTDLRRPDLDKPTEWTAIVYLIGGKEVKFRADDDWATNWGTSSGGNIPVSTTGYYKVDFNAGSGAYAFTLVSTTVFNSVGLIGAQSNWSTEIATLTMDPTNNQVWTGTIALTVGELKFRANQDWGYNWGISSGAAKNLSGYGVNNGSNISIATAGTYFIYINVATGDYFFGKTNSKVAYTDIGIIGDATPGGWDNDTNLTKNPSNPYKWSGKLTLSAGEAKFRADNDWAANWGDASFPTGVATSGGPNIKVTAGTYQITFNSSTGEYTFAK